MKISLFPVESNLVEPNKYVKGGKWNSSLNSNQNSHRREKQSGMKPETFEGFD